MKKLLIGLTFLTSLLTYADGGDYKRVLKGSCDVVDQDLKANFYIRDNDKHFDFDFLDIEGNIYEDNSAIHRQNIYTEVHGITLERDKIKMKARGSYYRADFVYNTIKKTAVFRHKKSCIRS